MPHTVREIEPQVFLVEDESSRTYLVGVAHVSRSSADLVQKTIREIQPETVCLELCPSRVAALKDPEAWRNTDILKVIRTGKGYVLFAQLILMSFQKRLGSRLQAEAGEEMRQAIFAAQDIGATLFYVDRDVRITLKRAWGEERLWPLIKLGTSLLLSILGGAEEIKEEEIEQMKKSDLLNALVEQFGQELPGIKRALLDERNSYMVQKVKSAPGLKKLVVVGAGHIPGMIEAWENNDDIATLEMVPPPRKIISAISWGIPLIIVALIIWGFYAAGIDAGKQMVMSWILATGSLAALGALLSLAHPLTIVSAFFAAPITCLNPTIAAGWVCALVEAIIHQPKIKDFETIADDLSSVRGCYRNRLSRIFVIMILVNLCASLGTLLGGFLIASQL